MVVKPTDAVLDVGAGDSKFVNDIRAARRYLLDLNFFTPLKAWAVESGSLDVVFSCNLFEQLPIKSSSRDGTEYPFMITEIF